MVIEIVCDLIDGKYTVFWVLRWTLVGDELCC